MERKLTRRQALQAAGSAGAALVVARSGVLERLTAEPAAAASCATVTPNMTEGPYWVDELLRRADVRGSQQGVPLTLKVNVQDATNACAPVNDAHVDIWHANAAGLYSDASQQAGGGNTKGQTWLRGYQVTGKDGSEGQVTFKTIWPGWYAGRTIHIHVRVRTYDSSGAVATNYTTQIFFAESDNTAVLTGATPYNTRSPQLDPTKNATDNILGSNAATNVLAASGGPSAGYGGTFTIMLSGGSSAGAGSAGSSSDKTVAATLASAKAVRTSAGRAVVLSVRSTESLTAHAKIVRGTKVLGQATGKLTDGTHALRVAVRSGTAAGAASLRLTLADAAGNTRTLTRAVTIPR
jgi:protocatechuate 3,4-dioxygenase beta subunit